MNDPKGLPMRAIAIRALALALLSILVGAAARAEGETVDDVIRLYLEAIGGREAIEALETVRKTGTYVYNGLEHPVVLIQKRDAGCREEIEGLTQWGTATEAGKRVIRAWDGENAWVGSQTEGLETATMPEAEAAGFVLDAAIAGSLVDWQQKGNAVELVGDTEVESIAVIEIAVEHADGTSEAWYLDRQTYLPVMRSTEVPDREFKAAMTWFFDDYRGVAGVQMPYYIQVEERLFTREYIFDTIEANILVNDDLFDQPDGSAVEPDS